MKVKLLNHLKPNQANTHSLSESAQRYQTLLSVDEAELWPECKQGQRDNILHVTLGMTGFKYLSQNVAGAQEFDLK